MSRFGPIDPETVRRILAAADGPVTFTEKGFQSAVMSFARHQGWRVYHTHDSRKSQRGYPDLTMVHRAFGLVFAELKTDTGRATPDQLDWLEDLRAAGCRAYLWRPDDWPEIERTLTGGPAVGEW